MAKRRYLLAFGWCDCKCRLCERLFAYGLHQHVPPHPLEAEPPPSYHLGYGRRPEIVHCTELLHTLYYATCTYICGIVVAKAIRNRIEKKSNPRGLGPVWRGLYLRPPRWSSTCSGPRSLNIKQLNYYLIFFIKRWWESILFICIWAFPPPLSSPSSPLPWAWGCDGIPSAAAAWGKNYLRDGIAIFLASVFFRKISSNWGLSCKVWYLSVPAYKRFGRFFLRLRRQLKQKKNRCCLRQRRLKYCSCLVKLLLLSVA